MTALKEEVLHTIDEIEALPEGNRAELINGDIYYMASPSVLHQELCGELFAAIHSHIKTNKGKCKVYTAPFAVYLFGIQDNTNYLEPDIVAVCDPEKTANGKGCDGAPDFVIEVVSPSTASRDYLYKLNQYQRAGVKEYWIVNPDSKSVNVYGFSDGNGTGAYSFSDAIPCLTFPGLTICMDDLR